MSSENAACTEDNDDKEEADNIKEEERKCSLHFVLPRKTTLMLTLTHSLFCFITRII